ncbi:MAG TPA: glycosyltransferase N-terminal domain-containing protein [Flavipsychrobacter sp.]
MQVFLYNIFLVLYALGIRVTSLFNEKARKWLRGRKGIFRQLADAMQGKDEQRIWVHCASLGEFEQGRPVIEAIKAQYPGYKIVLTFFSPSGYEIRKDYDGADYVFYLPMDGAGNAKRFIKLVNPSLAIFVKYEFWYHYLNQLKKQDVPTVLISAAFRSSQPFFKGYGGLFRKILKSFAYIFVQDENSKQLLADIGITTNVVISGDTRYDRVVQIAENARRYDLIERFKGDSKLLIAGSTWPDDEMVLREALHILPDDWKMIIAPHEIDDKHIQQLDEMFQDTNTIYSQLPTTHTGHRVLIIDNIGMLSSLYRYGDIAFVGGGFQKGGIHNVLEPAVFGLPVFFGPQYDKFVEAKALVSRLYAFPISKKEHFNSLLRKLMEDDKRRLSMHKTIQAYIAGQAGATAKIMSVFGDKFL